MLAVKLHNKQSYIKRSFRQIRYCLWRRHNDTYYALFFYVYVRRHTEKITVYKEGKLLFANLSEPYCLKGQWYQIFYNWLSSSNGSTSAAEHVSERLQDIVEKNWQVIVGNNAAEYLVSLWAWLTGTCWVRLTSVVGTGESTETQLISVFTGQWGKAANIACRKLPIKFD